MKIKSLKIHGFKSFPDRTEINLDAPFTALVGPNGCGKSNIVDAVKWVLGSQSPNSLRADEMADMIFKGSSSRDPLGFAKVELVFSNEDGEIPVDYSEVSIGRKLYRSGESVYELNGEEVRLKDIKELLYDTGIGVENYSLIEQGKIDQILSSSLTQRRELIEEAAGISTFQKRKEEAQRKLSRVDNDLERVRDVLNELNREIHSLKTQAGRARKYKEYKQELEDKKLLLTLDRYDELVQEEENLFQRWQDAKDRRNGLQEKMTDARTKEQEATKNFNELESRYENLESERRDLDYRIESIETDIDRFRERLGELDQEKERLQTEELEESAQKIEDLEDRLKAVSEKKKKQKKKLQELETKQSNLKEQIREYTRGLEELDQEEEELKQEKNSNQEQHDTKTRELERIQDRIRAIEERREELTRKKEKLENKIRKRSREKEEIQEQLDSLPEEIREREEELEELKSTKQEKEEKLEKATNRLEEARKELDSLQSRVEFLEELEEKGAGLPAGTRAILNSIENMEEQAGLHGLLADCIEFKEEGREILQGVLEPYLKCLVVEDWGTAERLMTTARQAGGSTGILVLEAIPARWARVVNTGGSDSNRPDMDSPVEERDEPVLPEEPFDFPMLSLPGEELEKKSTTEDVSQPSEFQLKELVDAEHRIRNLVSWLLKGRGAEEPFLVKHGNEDTFPPGGTVSDRNGLTLTGDGYIHYRGESRVEESLTDRRQEIDTLTDTIQDKQEAVEEIEWDVERLRTGLDAVTSAIQNRRTEIYEKRIDLQNLEEQMEWVNEELEVHHQERSMVEQEMEEGVEEKEKLQGKISDLKELIETLNRRQDKLDGKLEDLREEKQKARERLRQRRDKENKVNMQIAQLEEKIENLDEKFSMLEEDLEQAEDRLEATRTRIDELEQKKEEIISSLEQNREEMVRCKTQKEQVEEQLESIEERKEKLREKQEKMEEERERISKNYREIQEKAQELKINLREVETRRENLEERADEELERDLENQYEEFDPEHEEEFDREKLEEEVRELESSLNNMGNVNLAALEQLEEAEERAESIEEQEEDLVKSKKRLQRIIRKMKKESKKRFKRTLKQGKENFNNLFRKLFGGGQARLEAVYDEEEEEEQDILECGIEIFAQPPGKEMTTLSLLSGGEKAMTSIALMMSLFMLNPSAICILDEADAPLDESNLDLFIGLIDEFTDITQFLVVTHKKKTIAAADRVYGLTMQEKGVSDLVTLDLEKRIPEEYVEPEEEPSTVAGPVSSEETG